MKPKVYIETTIPSYLTAWTSGDLIRAAHQLLTKDWWTRRRADFDLFFSQVVLQEIAPGEPLAATERLQAVHDLPILDVTEEAILLAEDLIREGSLPRKAELDALHIATAVVNGKDFLLTWNCRHIANATLRVRIEM